MMDIVFLVYGLAFLLLGVTIVIRIDPDSEMEVSGMLWLLAAFAFVHGLLEWTDLWRVVRGDTALLAAARPGVLLVSYLFLFEFGRRLVLASLPAAARARPAAAPLRVWIYLPMLLAILIAMLVADRPLLALAVWARYLPGFFGAVLAGAGCYFYCGNRLRANLAETDFPGVHVFCYAAAAAFFAYGIAGGLVVPPAPWFPATLLNEQSFRAAFGFPVQLLRAACAVAIAFSVGGLLRVFDIEGRQKLRRARGATQSALAELSRLNQRNAAILDSAAEGIVGLDGDGRTIFVNDAALEMLGFEESELLGRSFHALSHHSTADGQPYAAADCPILGRLQGADDRRIGEDWLWRKDGTPFAIEYRTAPLRDPEAGVQGAVLVFHDISERRRNEAAVRRSERRMRALLDASPESTLLLDAEGKILALNRIAAKRFKHAAEDMVGQNLFEFLPADLAESRRAVLRQVVASGEPARVTDRRGMTDFEHNVFPVVSDGGAVESVAVYAKDITEQLLAQRLDTMFHHLDLLQLKWRMGLAAVAQTFCDELRPLLGLDALWIGHAVEDGTLDLVAASGRHEDFLAAVRANCRRWDDGPLACVPARAVLRSGRPEMMPAGDAACGACGEAAQAAGMPAMLMLPLTLRGQIWGVLALHAAQPELFERPNLSPRLAVIASRACVSLESALQQEWLMLLETALSSTGSAVFITDAAARILWANASFYRLSGYAAADILGQTPRLLHSGVQDAEFYRGFWRTIAAGDTWRGEVVNARRDGSRYTAFQIVTPLCNADGRISHYVSILEDVSEKKAAEERIRHMANFDALTDLPNRATLFERLGQALALARRSGDAVALLFLDLDRFKEINDTLGHDAGDHLLQAVSNRLLGQVRETDIVARFAGDEFVIILPRIAHADDAQRVAEKIVAALAHPFNLKTNEASIGISIGVALFPDHGGTPEQLLSAADKAMYRAKQAGRNCVKVFEA